MNAAVFLQKSHPYTFALLFAFMLTGYFITGNDILFSGLGILFILSASFLFSFLPSLWLLTLLGFTVPFSIQADIGPTGINIFFPSEILTGIFAGTVIIKMLQGEITNRSFLLHPVTILIVIYFLCTLTTGLFSTMPVVSIKSMLVKGTYLLVFYFLAFDAQKHQTEKSFYRCIVAYSTALIPIIVYGLSRFSAYGYAKDAADYATLPFYKDHTIYSACVAFLIPVFACRTFLTDRNGKGTYSLINAILLIVLFVGLFFSFSRAAWISVMASFGFFIILILRIRPGVLLLLLAVCSIFLFYNADNFFAAAKGNKNDSNMRNADIEMQTKSVVNISTDQSNAERLNRWKCALRMFNDKPFTGFGSGTYMFKYFDYQRKADMTYISVTSPYNAKPGRGGSVHSEYLLVLSENGIFTCIVFLILIMQVIYTGMKNAYHHPDKIKRTAAAALTLALTTYLVHGLFNNFLDTDKAAFLFWTSVCMIVMIDLERKELNFK